MGKFKPAANLDAKAAKAVRRQVDRVAEAVKEQAGRNAPGVKQWISQGDGRVRHTHRQVDGQKRPANLRYDVPSMPWDQGHGRRPENLQGMAANRVGPVTHLFYDAGQHSAQPGNFQEALRIAYTNAVHCRCYTEVDPNGLSRELRRDDAKARGAKCRARVHITAPFVIQAELGDYYYLGDRAGEVEAKGTHFMVDAARSVAQQLKHSSRRR